MSQIEATLLGGSLLICGSLLCPLMLVMGVVYKRKREAIERWLSTPATVVESGVKLTSRKSLDLYIPKVVYEYEVDGHLYQSSHLSISDMLNGRTGIYIKAAEQEAKRYGVGKKLKAYYDPTDPNKAVLDNRLPRFFGERFFALSFFFLLVGVGGAILLMQSPLIP